MPEIAAAACPARSQFHVMPRPCDASSVSGPCPFRRDAPPGEFPAERYEKLAETAGARGNEAPLNAPMFACHHTRDGAPVACAGWMAVCGLDHLGVRLALADGRLNGEQIRLRKGWPDLYDSYDEMATSQSADRPYDPERALISRGRAGHFADMVYKIMPGLRR